MLSLQPSKHQFAPPRRPCSAARALTKPRQRACRARHEGSVPPRPAYRLDVEFIIVVVSGCTATDRHLPPKSSALPAGDIPHRFGDERD